MSADEFYYRVTPIENTSWELRECNPTNRPREISIVSVSSHSRIESLEIYPEEGIYVSYDAPHEGTGGGMVSIAAVVALLRAAGYTITEPSP